MPRAPNDVETENRLAPRFGANQFKKDDSMNTQSLAGQWQFRQAGTDEWLPATVPGGVHTHEKDCVS